MYQFKYNSFRQYEIFMIWNLVALMAKKTTVAVVDAEEIDLGGDSIKCIEIDWILYWNVMKSNILLIYWSQINQI